MASTSGLQHRCVFVGNIPYDATEEHLIQICEEVGPVVSFRLVLDKETGRPKGYGFCEYKDEETALSARRNLQGYEINGRQLRVDFAENDKGVDRNREQGRGGPGLTSSTDSQKSLAGQPFVGDATLHQLLVLPQAAASVMAEALGGPQSSNLPQFRNGLPSVPGSGNDLLTNYLANMSRYQLNEIMLEMKTLATKNRAQAQQLLQAIPQLTKALFQAQIMLGMVTPQMMQVAGNQKTLSAVANPSVQDNKQDLKSVTPYLGQVALYKEAAIETFSRPSEAQGKIVLPNSAVFQHSLLPPKHIPLHTYRPPLPQNQVPVEGAIPGIAGVAMPPNVQAPPLPTSRSSLQVLPSLLHHSRPGGTKSIGHQHQGPLPNASLQQSFFSHPLTSQIASLNHSLLSSGLEMLSREARPSQSSLDLTSTSRIRTEPSSVGLVKQNEMSNKEIGLSSNPSKRPRLEEGGIAHNLIGENSSVVGFSLAQSSNSGLSVGTQISNPDGLQHTQKQMPQLSTEEESALLQQLMSLTPEQLRSLPSEQQQQVLEIQRTLRSKPLL